MWELYSTYAPPLSVFVLYLMRSPSDQPFAEYKWGSDIELEEGVQAGIRPTVPASAPADYVELMKQCWSADVSGRPTFTHATRQLRIVMQRIGGSQPLNAAELLPVREERLRTTTFAFLPPSGSTPVPASASSSAVIESHLSRQLRTF